MHTLELFNYLSGFQENSFSSNTHFSGGQNRIYGSINESNFNGNSHLIAPSLFFPPKKTISDCTLFQPGFFVIALLFRMSYVKGGYHNGADINSPLHALKS